MAGVDHLVVYMETALKYNTFISRPKPGGGIYLWGPHGMDLCKNTRFPQTNHDFSLGTFFENVLSPKGTPKNFSKWSVWGAFSV